jgi:hypothetical protein
MKFFPDQVHCEEYARAGKSDWQQFAVCATLILAEGSIAARGWGGSLESPKGTQFLVGGSLLLAVLQSICTAVLTISGIRLAIGLTAFTLAGSTFAPIRHFHHDAIRIPMLTLAALGALVDLGVLAWIWHLRRRPSAKWRQSPMSQKAKRSERLQVALAVLTLVLVGTETWLHFVTHRPHVDPVTKANVS